MEEAYGVSLKSSKAWSEPALNENWADGFGLVSLYSVMRPDLQNSKPFTFYEARKGTIIADPTRWIWRSNASL